MLSLFPEADCSLLVSPCFQSPVWNPWASGLGPTLPPSYWATIQHLSTGSILLVCPSSSSFQASTAYLFPLSRSLFFGLGLTNPAILFPLSSV